MDQKRIEEGLKRLERNVEVEKVEKLKKQQEAEQEEQVQTVRVLSEEEAANRDAVMKEKYPEDRCSQCKTHVVDGRYLVLPHMGAIVCGVCRNIFMPKSKYDEALDILVNRMREEESKIVVPEKRVIPVVSPR